MIMDEPTNNLGVPEQQKVLELIRKLRDQGVPVILITHTLPDVFAVSDRLMVMHRGRKVTEKKTADTSTQELVQYMVGVLDDTKIQLGRKGDMASEATRGSAPASAKWVTLPYHRRWLLDQASALFDFFEPHSIDPSGGFFTLDDTGRPIGRKIATGELPPREIHVDDAHGALLRHRAADGPPGADRFIDHGMEFLWNGHRDRKHGGYFWAIGENGPSDPLKQAYGHAFVLLAASSAKARRSSGCRPAARRCKRGAPHPLLGEAARRGGRGIFADWQPISKYRGQNSNMHLTESLMAAFEATGDSSWLEMAESIASLVIGKRAAENGWRVAEHFNEKWELDRDYANGDVFRPYGTTPGHSLEWTRLLLQLWELGGRRLAWLPEAAKAVFDRATAEGWDARKAASSTRSTGRHAPHAQPALVAGGRRYWRGSLPERHRRRAKIRGVVPSHLGFRRRPADRPRERRLADGGG